MNKIFITGIGTDVGKTVVSAIVTESLKADYWKPIQAGDLENSDSHKVERLISNSKTIFYPNSYALKHPESPHSAAKKDGVEIELTKVIEPATTNDLVIEGAGGLLVPLNDTDTIIDLIKPDYQVILVSQNYLGSINHTLLSIEVLTHRNIKIAGIIFNGDENKETEAIIKLKTGINVIGRVEKEPTVDKQMIKKYADLFRDKLEGLVN